MNTRFYSLVRKGLGSQINEIDNLGQEKGETKKRPTVQLTAIVEAKGLDNGEENSSEPITRTEAKTITLSGPGDVVSINSNSILRVFPTPESQAFPINEFPYIEFWEPDFAWRFTPAKATEEKKLRPWLTLVVCKTSEVSIEKTSWGVDLVTFNVDEDGYKRIFPSQTDDVWKMAHAQSNVGQNAEFCRILGIQSEKMDEYTEYRAFLIPVFEIGRLRGLRGPNYDENLDKSEQGLNNIPAQRAAWEDSLGAQKEEHERPLTFPSYYSWSFTTGDLSFTEKVKALVCNDAKKSGIAVDVTSLGEGLDYAVLDSRPKRDCINMPAALTTVDSQVESKYPMPRSGNSSSDENQVYENLNSLLSKSPIFEENAKLVNDDAVSANADKDDPWITPPIYGGKHILATSLDEKKNSEHPWLNQVNLDLHYRAAAGLGKKAVQRNQEELVNRAWKQIDAVKMLNAELNQKMLSANVSDSVKYLNYSWAGTTDDKVDSKNENDITALMMKNLSLMKNTKLGEDGSSLSDVLYAKNIPEAFASVSFQNAAQKILNSSDDTSIFKCIANGQWSQQIGLPVTNTISAADLKTTKERMKTNYVKFLLRLPSENEEIGPWTLFSYVNTNKIQSCITSNDFTNFNGSIESIKQRPNRVMSRWFGISGLKLSNKSSADKRFLVENKFWEISTCGKTDGGDSVYALDDACFRKIFFLKQDKSVTVVKINSKFYVNRDYIKRDSVKFLNGNIELRKMCEDKYKNTSIIVRDAYVDMKIKEVWSDSEIEELFKLIANYMPDGILAENDFWKKEKYLEFNNAWDFYVDMAGRAGGQFKTLLDAWNNLGTFIQSFNPEEDPVPIDSTRSVPNQVAALKNGLRDDSAYTRLKECADTYYKTFFTSAELRKNYLEDCLASKYPIKAYPIFPEPAYYYLKDLADEFILPGIEDLPDDSISMFKGNAAFVESYLCGMNTEMGRELLWREYPTDQRGSYFKKFWDSETTVDDIKNENYFDINSIHRWNKKLGENHVETENKSTGKKESKGDLLFFAIKSQLMNLYPDTLITLRKAYWKQENDNPLEFFVKDGGTVENGEVLKPVSQAFVRDDVYVVGFKIKAKEALGSFQKDGNGKMDKNSGYMLAFEKASENVEFKIDNRANATKDSAEFASNSVENTSIVGKHVLTLIG